MDDRLNEAVKIVEDFEKQSELSKIEELLRDNKISFEYKEKKYRVRLLNLAEKEELDTLRRKKFGQLLKDKDILLEKDLIVQYKEREIYIEEMNEKVSVIDSESYNLQLKLGESIAKNEGEAILKEYKDQITALRIKKEILIAQKTLLLELCLENQLLNYVSQIISYLSLEELRDGIWQRAFTSLDDFLHYEDDKLIGLSSQYSMFLHYL